MKWVNGWMNGWVVDGWMVGGKTREEPGAQSPEAASLRGRLMDVLLVKGNIHRHKGFYRKEGGQEVISERVVSGKVALPEGEEQGSCNSREKYFSSSGQITFETKISQREK